MRIRRAVPEDAEAYAQLRAAVLSESEFMLREPGEYRPDMGEVARQIATMNESGNSAVLLAHCGSELVGFVTATGGRLNRTRHAAEIAMAVRRAHWGQGIGMALLSAIRDWAGAAGVQRLELNVAVPNERGVALYKRAGFEVEGVRRAAVLSGGQYQDDYVMAMLLGDAGQVRGAGESGIE